MPCKLLECAFERARLATLRARRLDCRALRLITQLLCSALILSLIKSNSSGTNLPASVPAVLPLSKKVRRDERSKSDKFHYARRSSDDNLRPMTFVRALCSVSRCVDYHVKVDNLERN